MAQLARKTLLPAFILTDCKPLAVRLILKPAIEAVADFKRAEQVGRLEAYALAIDWLNHF